jgi:hypothetical protein
MQINVLDMVAALSDVELIQHVKRLAANERQSTAQLVAHLAEMDARRLYLGEGCSSLFTYCTQVLHLSEHGAYGRIEAARAARKFPMILDALGSGALHLTAVTLIAPYLTVENVERVIAAATHKTKREVEELVAALRPRPPVPSSIRKLPLVTRAASIPKAAAIHTELPISNGEPVATQMAGAHAPIQQVPRADIKPLAPEQYLVKFTASRAMHEKLREAQALLRHQVPSGDVAEIFDRALTLLVADLRKARYAATARPRSPRRTSKTSRHVAAAVKREVWARDGGQCAFLGAAGRCTERGLLEYHHLIPFVDGGASDASNLQLRCRAHNSVEVEGWSGPREEDFLREVSPIYGGASSGISTSSNSGFGRQWQWTRSRTEKVRISHATRRRSGRRTMRGGLECSHAQALHDGGVLHCLHAPPGPHVSALPADLARLRHVRARPDRARSNLPNGGSSARSVSVRRSCGPATKALAAGAEQGAKAAPRPGLRHNRVSRAWCPRVHRAFAASL